MFAICTSLNVFYSIKSKTIKPVLETTCIKTPSASRDHYSDTTTLLKST